jgi:MoaA/NifB/PqqE/SkfB family radical SAM enzyme
MIRKRGSHGWREIDATAKRAIIDNIAAGRAPGGPLHLELDICDRCNVDCYFCNAMDVRTRDQVPLERVVEIVDDAVGNGLRSVRFAGGGDPLFHREIDRVIDHVHSRGLVIDNITSNGLGLSPAVASRLVEGKTREILISLNAADAADYARMMQVKPAIFDKILENIRHLVAIRGDAAHPCLVIQFLLDRQNYRRLPDMYALGRGLRADVIAVNLVLEIPRHRIDPNILLNAGDGESLRPYLRDVIAADRDAGLLEMCFSFDSYNQLVTDLEVELGTSVCKPFTTAPSFREENGACFFGFYSAVVRGNGDMYPCCMLINPDYKPIGNAVQGSFSDQWNGPGFNTLRHEMREVLIAGEDAVYQEGRFQTLMPQCVNAHACALKNMYFRSDDDFYRDLGAALEKTRAREIRWIGSRQQIARALQRVKARHPKLRRTYERVAGPRIRALLRKTLGVRYSST